MPRRYTILALAVVSATTLTLAQGRVKHYGRSVVEFKSEAALAVASYDYSQANHDGPWLLVDFAIQTKSPTVYKREQFALVTPDEKRLPLATHEQYLSERADLTKLFQNATSVRRPLGSYFTSPLNGSIKFFATNSGTIDHTFATHADDVASGELLFRSPDGKWAAGTYRLVIAHEKAPAELPIELK